MKSISFIISLCLSIVFSQFLQAQPGSLDNSFGNDGIVIAPLTDHSEQAYKVIVQPDGKILLAGFQEENNIGDFAVARYNISGTLDETFGNGGLAIIDGGTDSEYAYDMVLQNDGKIILGGSVYNQFTTVDDFALLRLNPDGSTDNTFGTGGIVTTDIDDQWDNAYGMALQDDGKILLGGDGYTNGKRNVCVVRYNTNGSLDASFGTAGIALNSIGTNTDKTRDIAIQADGKILACGYFNDGIDNQSFVTRFNTDGTLDNTFGNNGTATLDIGGNDDRLWSLCILDDGKILAGGYTRNASNDNDYLMVRYLADGTLDNSFGSNGIKMHNFNGTDIIIEIILQEDGKILTAGGAFTFELARFLENGDVDTGFGNNGIVNTNINTGFDFCQSLCLQADGKIILAGHSRESDEYDFSLARYHSEEGGFIIDQDKTFQSVSLYPNPVSDNHFTIEYLLSSGQDISVELLSADGKQVQVLQSKQHRKAGNNIEVLSLPGSISAGLYFIRLSSPDGSSILKLNVD